MSRIWGGNGAVVASRAARPPNGVVATLYAPSEAGGETAAPVTIRQTLCQSVTCHQGAKALPAKDRTP